MNISESMKYVLKTKGPGIFSEFWKEDLAGLVGQFLKDVQAALKGPKKLKDLNLSEVRDSAIDAYHIARDIPNRVKNGFSQFRSDILQEFDKQTDPKERAMFAVRVTASLCSFVLSSFYDVQKARSEISLPGLRRSNAFTRFLLAELLLKITQLFALRFLDEVEKEVTDPEDRKRLQFFKQLVRQPPKEAGPGPFEGSPRDRAHDIVDSLRNYLMSGHRG